MRDAINRVQINPNLYPTVESDVKRCLVRTFPYAVLFRVGAAALQIVAIMHLHRDPGYWKQRVRPPEST